MNKNRILLVILGLHVVLSLGYAVLTPLWQGHEPDYYNVVRFLVTNQRLPTVSDYPVEAAYTSQATQPPLYFVLVAPVVALLDNGEPVLYGFHPQPICLGAEHENPVILPYISTPAYDQPLRGTIAAAYGLRLINVLLGALSVFLTYQTALILFSRNPIIALIACALLAFEPATLRDLMWIGNDTLVLTISTATLFFSAKLLLSPKVVGRDLIALMLLAIAAPLIKLPGWVDLALALAILTYKLIFTRRAQRLLLVGIAGIVLLTIGVGAFNFQHYGSVLGRYSVLDTFMASLLRKAQIPPVVVSAVLDATHGAALEPLVALQPRAAFVTLYNGLLALCLICVGVGAVRALIKRDASTIKAFALLLALTVMTVMMVVLRNTLIANADNTTAYNTGLIYAPIRYYIPALPALALLVSAGFYALLPQRKHNLLGAIPLASFGLISVGGVLLLLLTRPPNPVISADEFARLANLEQVSEQPSTDAPQILGYRLQPHADLGRLDLTLYLTLKASTDLDYMAQAELVGGTTPLERCQFLPTNGVDPTPRWQPGQIVVAQASIPICTALPDDTSLALRWLAYTRAGTLSDSSDAIPLAQLLPSLAQSKTCPPNLGVIGGYQLVQWNSPAAIQREEPYLPSVNWIVLNPLPTARTRVFEFTHEATGRRFTCAGSPADGTHALASWKPGEYVYFDTCFMQFPADAPAGDYTVRVGIEDANEVYLPSDDDPSATLLTVGKIHLDG